MWFNKKRNYKKNYKANYKEERLLSYWIWYLENFDTVSSEKIREKLLEKTENNEIAKKVFNKLIEYWYINDIVAINKLIEKFLFKFKDKNYIINNLLQKKFKKEDILKVLEEKYKNNRYLYFWQDFTEERLAERIKYLLKNKSINEIINKLSSNDEEREYIKRIIEKNKEVIWLDNEKNVLYNKIVEYTNKKNINLEEYNEKTKVIKYFLWKRYKYNDIKEIVDKLIDENNNTEN